MRPAFRALPWIVLTLALLATYGSWRLLQDSVEARAEQRFQQESEATREAILSRLMAYELVLRGAAGMFFASEEVTSGEFQTYVGMLRLHERYGGVQGIGYATLLRAAEVAEHEARIRAQDFPEYQIHPPGTRPLYGVITFLEPYTSRNRRAFGFDMFSEPVRREAMERARDTGSTAISGKVILVQEDEENPQPGFLMYLPVYEGGSDPVLLEQRRAQIRGFVYAPFRVQDLMRRIRFTSNTLISFAIYDGPEPSPQTLLYEEHLASAGDQPRRRTGSLSLGGRTWTIIFTESQALRTATASAAPSTMAVAGLFISVILFAITWLLLRLGVERRQAEQTLLKAEIQVLQAQKMESVGQLTGGIAHDFNNLLTVVLGNAELLLEKLKDTQLIALAEMIRSAAERGSELTGRLLSFARRQPLDPRQVDVGELVLGMEDILRRSLGEHVELEVTPGMQPWKATIDPAQLENALLNLCLNARDAMPGGGKLVIDMVNAHLDADYARDHAEVAAGDYVMIAVSDTGSGMPPEIAARAFEPFFTTKTEGKGSGLGLSMVYGFAKQSRGHVKIYSEPGIGTTVRLYLPRSDNTAEPHEPVSPAVVEGGSALILLVEDDDLVRRNVAAQLEALGYDMLVARNGHEALDLLRHNPEIDLLFTDIVMPGGLNGRQLADAAQQIKPGLPVLYTSGYSENVIVHHGRLDRGMHLLNKPYGRRELSIKIRTALGRD
ncbi:CHASE domain-containing protein [Oceanibaculum pacificum]|uniref:histidine kinase n=1 Tax=Oceanibaculum pacificum TaxID=580166 RepID=A0A154W2C8_9PROT|nr:CHASE domain-containing protein [Oceanibaculum pacificum]KZD07613.1 hypothetical protein AUP43_10010 [Oceanibaculum pacificum]